MEPSALESISRSLESSLDWWGVFILVSTAIVAIGLVVEYWEPVREFIEECRRPAASFPWYKFMGLAGGILVTLGVFGEFWGAYKASRVETNLRGNNHRIEIFLNEKASKNEKDTEQLRKDAEGLKAENLKLEAIIAPRSLSLGQQRRIADACRKFHGHGVLVKSYGTDGEGFALAAQIIAALRAADVVVADSRAAEMTVGEFDTGVHVRAPDAEYEFASTLANALSSIGKLKVFPVNDPEPKVGVSWGEEASRLPIPMLFSLL
jgi:hypothetical protein